MIVVTIGIDACLRTLKYIQYRKSRSLAGYANKGSKLPMTAHKTRERVLQNEKIDKVTKHCVCYCFYFRVHKL